MIAPQNIDVYVISEFSALIFENSLERRNLAETYMVGCVTTITMNVKVTQPFKRRDRLN